MTCLPYYKCIDIQIVIAKFISQQLSLDYRGNPRGSVKYWWPRRQQIFTQKITRQDLGPLVGKEIYKKVNAQMLQRYQTSCT